MTYNQDGSPFFPGTLSDKEIEDKLKWSHEKVSKLMEGV